MKSLFITLITACVLSSCMSPKKCATLTDYNYGVIKYTTKLSTPKKVFVELPQTKLGTTAKGEQLASSFLPAIFYWKNKNQILVYPNLAATKCLLEENIQKSCETQKIGNRFDSLKISISNYDNSFIFNSESESYFLLLYLLTNTSKSIIDNSKETILKVDIDVIVDNQHLKRTLMVERKSTFLDFDGETREVFIKNFIQQQQETERKWTDKLAEAIKLELLNSYKEFK